MRIALTTTAATYSNYHATPKRLLLSIRLKWLIAKLHSVQGIYKTKIQVQKDKGKVIKKEKSSLKHYDRITHALASKGAMCPHRTREHTAYQARTVCTSQRVLKAVLTETRVQIKERASTRQEKPKKKNKNRK
jgi:hypothetical protein